MSKKFFRNGIVILSFLLAISAVFVFIFADFGNVEATATTASSINSEINSVKEQLSSLESRQNLYRKRSFGRRK